MVIPFKESIIVGFSDLWSRKIRTLVTITGIILGTMSIIVVLSLMNGIQKKTMEWMMERGGLAKITVRRDWNYESPTNEPKVFTLREINLIKSLVPEAKYMNPVIRAYIKYSYKKNNYWGPVRGVLTDFSAIEEWDVEKGRFINEIDIREYSDVIVIGTKVKEELFGNEDPIGKWITAHGKRVQVIGIMKHRFMENSGAVGNDNALSYLNRRCFIPLSTMVRKGTGNDEINSFTVKAYDANSAPDLREKLEAIILNLRHGEPVFRIESAQEEAEKMKQQQLIFTIIFFLISAISMLVGGIVIMNIMLATIKERTREIGIRITVGAKRNDIFFQFLIQTILITFLGGIVGVFSGISILSYVSEYLKIELFANAFTILIAITVSVGLGMVSGIIPAIMASRLNPVEALRYE
ncbi:MAG: ABC transporter permease [Candidatus Cloacimonetes bacterium]|nr:ABC transporter permease [Candidatus Cloacimonadota bacterium]